MGRKKREPLNPEKKNIIAELIKTYKIKTAQDIQDALKDLLGDTIQEMLESEMNEHLGYEKYERGENTNSRNGYKTKRVRSGMENTKLMFLKIEIPLLNLKLSKKTKGYF